MLSYSELQREVEGAPMTWLPALLLIVVRACIRRRVFKDNAALLRVVESVTKEKV